MAAHDGLFSHLKLNTNLGTYEHYLPGYQLDENWDETFPQSKCSLLIIGLQSHAK